MNLKTGLGTGVAFILLLAMQGAVTGAAQAEDAGALARQIVERVNTGTFLGRNKYEIAISGSCEIVVKEIYPKCPDQRAEFSFNMINVMALADATSGALMVKSSDQSKVILQRLYYRGATPRDRRFCLAPEGSTLKHEDKMLNERSLFYTDDAPFLADLVDSFSRLKVACKEALAN